MKSLGETLRAVQGLDSGLDSRYFENSWLATTEDLGVRWWRKTMEEVPGDPSGIENQDGLLKTSCPAVEGGDRVNLRQHIEGGDGDHVAMDGGSDQDFQAVNVRLSKNSGHGLECINESEVDGTGKIVGYSSDLPSVQDRKEIMDLGNSNRVLNSAVTDNIGDAVYQDAAGNVNRDGEKALLGLQYETEGNPDVDFLNLSSSAEGREAMEVLSNNVGGNCETEDIVPDVFSQSCFPVGENIMQDALTEGDAGRVGNDSSVGSENELVNGEKPLLGLPLETEGNLDVEFLNLSSSVEGRKGLEVLSNDMGGIHETQDIVPDVFSQPCFPVNENNIEDALTQGDAGNENSVGNEFSVGSQNELVNRKQSLVWQHETKGNLDVEFLNSNSNVEGRKGLEVLSNDVGDSHETEDIMPDVFSQPCFPIGENSIEDAFTQGDAGNGNGVGNGLSIRSQDELVNAGVETVDTKVNDGAQNGANEIHDDFGLLNGMNKNRGQEGSQSLSWQPPEEYVQHVSGKDNAGTNNGEQIVVVQEHRESISASQEETGIAGKQQESDAVGFIERDNLHDDRIGQHLVEQDGALRELAVELVEPKEPVQDGDFRPTVIDQGCCQNSYGTTVEQHRENNTCVTEVHTAEGHVVEALLYLPLVDEGLEGELRDQPSNVQYDPVVGNLIPYIEAEAESCLDAFAPSEEVEQTEQVQGEPQVGNTEKPSVEKVSINVGSAAVYSRIVDEKGTSNGVAFDQEKEVSFVRDITQPEGHEEASDLQEGQDKNIQDCSSTSPLPPQSTKKRQHRRSFSRGSTSEKLTLVNYVSERQFSVGDLVWGKVRSHPRWPGQIFDPTDASEIANKYFRNDSLLVAFFGDATFGWCEESQLVPFQSHFSENAKQTSARAFRNALMHALDELARRVELGLNCPCQSEEARHVLENKAIANSGIRQGAIVNNHTDISHAIYSFDPSKFLSTIRSFAESPHMERNLEITVACAQASAILAYKGLVSSGKIPVEALGIQTVSLGKQGFPKSVSTSEGTPEDRIRRVSNSGVKRVRYSSSYGNRKCSSEGNQPRRMKTRSIGDLIAGSDSAREDTDGDETLFELAGSKAKLLRRLLEIPQKRLKLDSCSTGPSLEDKNAGSWMVEKIKCYPAKSQEEEEGSLPRRTSPLKSKKHRQLESVASDVLNNDSKAMDSKELMYISPDASQDAKKTPKSFKVGGCMRKVASKLSPTPSGTKSMDGSVWQNPRESAANLAIKTDKSIFSSPSNKPCATKSVGETSSTGELLRELLVVAQNPLYWAKKMKMLSRLINYFLEFRNAVFEKSSMNSDISKAAARNFANQSHKLKSSQSSSKSPSTADSKDLDWTDQASYPRPTGHVVQAKLKRKAKIPAEDARKKKKPAVRLSNPPLSKKGSKQELKEEAGDRYAKQYSRRSMITESPVNSLAGSAADRTVNQKPATLFMRFPRGFALPSEIELKAKFARFGPLDISETKVFRRSGCAQVAFKRSSAAESAFNYVSENDIFGSTTVSFRLRYPSPETQVDTTQKNEHGKHGRNNSLSKDTVKDADGLQENVVQPSDSVALSAEKLSTSKPNTSGEPQLLLIQQNLEMLTSMLSRSNYASTSTTTKSDNVEPDSKADIMDEMMTLLQKVSALVSPQP